MTDAQSDSDLSGALLSQVSNAKVVAQVDLVLGIGAELARSIIAAFDEFVAQPLERALIRTHGRDLAQRNPMIYTARGIDSLGDWVSAVLTDQETSRVENLLGTWQEEVARIVSGGEKPAGGVDLQVRQSDGVVRLYAIQTAPNTKNASGRRSDVRALREGAAILNAQRQHVELFIAVLHGRRLSRPLAAHPGIVVLGSDDFWSAMSGVADFRARLMKATAVLSDLVAQRSLADVERIRAEAASIYDDGVGGLNLEALANPPARGRVPRSEQLSLLA